MFNLLAILLLPISSLFASNKQIYVYETRVLLAAKATLKIEVENSIFNGAPVKFIRSNTHAYLFGKEIYNLDYMAYSKMDLTPITNIECEIEKKDDPDDKNCKQILFLEHQQFAYKKLHLKATQLPPMHENDQGVTIFDINEQQPDFDQNLDHLYDIASLALTIEQLNLSVENPERIFYLAVNKTIAMAKVQFVKNISKNEQWIKIIPLRPSIDEFDTPFPHKIIYDTHLRVVTEVHQKLPIVGNTVIKLNKKKSAF